MALEQKTQEQVLDQALEQEGSQEDHGAGGSSRPGFPREFLGESGVGGSVGVGDIIGTQQEEAIVDLITTT